MESIGIREDGLALLLLLVRKSVAAHQFVYYRVGLGQLAALNQLDALLYQHLLVYLIGEHLFQIAKDRQQEGARLPEVGLGRGRRRDRGAGGHDHPMQVGRPVGEGALRVVAAVAFHEVLTQRSVTLHSCVL